MCICFNLFFARFCMLLYHMWTCVFNSGNSSVLSLWILTLLHFFLFTCSGILMYMLEVTISFMYIKSFFIFSISLLHFELSYIYFYNSLNFSFVLPSFFVQTLPLIFFTHCIFFSRFHIWFFFKFFSYCPIYAIKFLFLLLTFRTRKITFCEIWSTKLTQTQTQN